MGGGTVWRGMSRLVSPAARVASASAGSSNSCSFCKIGGSSAQAPKVQSARLGGGACACTPETSLQAGRTSQQGAPVAMLESDDWEFAEEERLDHIVFGSLPSRTEVEEASSELQGALRLGLVAPTNAQASSPRALSPELIGQTQQSVQSSSTVGEEEEVSKPIVAVNRLALDWMEPPPISASQILSQHGGRNNVAEAFHQFQHNPEVQNMVVSLATDPAIWDAVMANEKIQEFKRKLEGDESAFTEKEPLLAESTDATKILHQEPSILMRLQAYWQDKLSKFVDTLGGIINGFLSAADKKVFAEEDGDVLDRVVKSCSMLAVVVVCLVLLKRSNIQVS